MLREKLNLARSISRDQGSRMHPSRSFRVIARKRLWRGDGEALGQVELPHTLESEANAYHVHPALLDACLQVMAAALPGQGVYAVGSDSYLPSGLASVRVYGRPGSRLWCHTALRSGAALGEETLEGDIRVLDEKGEIAAEVLGLRLVRLGHDTKRPAQANLSDCLYKLEWRPRTSTQAEHDLVRLQPD